MTEPDKLRVVAAMDKAGERGKCEGCDVGVPARGGVHWVDLYDKSTGECVSIEKHPCRREVLP